MAEYYFVGTLLPALSFNFPSDNALREISFNELETLFRDNLTAKDFEKTIAIRRFYDILNLRALWLEDEIDPRGEMSALELSEALAAETGLPPYVYSFIDHFADVEDRLRHFPFLLAKFFQSCEQNKDPFLRKYFAFERELRLVMTAFRARKLGRDLMLELQYENPEEELIAQLLAQKDAKIFEPGEKFQELKILFEKYGDDPISLQRALDEYRFNTIESFVDMADMFSIKRMLAYFLQFFLIEKWVQLDKAKGKQIVEAIVRNSETSLVRKGKATP